MKTIPQIKTIIHHAISKLQDNIFSSKKQAFIIPSNLSLNSNTYQGILEFVVKFFFLVSSLLVSIYSAFLSASLTA